MGKIRFLNNNHIKIIACITMLIDHVGMIFFPSIPILRIIGRVSFPLFGYMIAEGCKYSKNKLKHFLILLGVAIICQAGYYVYNKSLYMSVLVTFTLAQACIFSLQYFKKCLFERDLLSKVFSFIFFACVIAFCIIFCNYFEVSYGIYGVLLPLICSLFDFRGINVRGWVKKLDNFYVSVFLFAIATFLLTLEKYVLKMQHFGLLAVLIILLYNGKKGKLNLKYFFYIFYPAHLVLLEGLYLLII